MLDTLDQTQALSSRADVQTNLFLNPPETGSNQADNSEWSLGSQQQLRWKTNITNYDLMLYQQLACGDNDCVNGPVMIKENLKSDASSFIWSISTGSLSLSTSRTFFLKIQAVDDELNQFISSNLNFTGGAAASASSQSSARISPTTVIVTSTPPPSSSSESASQSTTVPAPSSSGSATSSSRVSETSSLLVPSAPTSVPSSTPTALPATSSDGGFSTGAKIAMMIGAISAVVIAIILGWYLGRRRQSKSKKSPFHPFEAPSSAPLVQLSELHVPNGGEQKVIPHPFTPRELLGKGRFDSFTGVRELDAWAKPTELGDGRRSAAKSGVYELGPRYT